MTSIYGPRGLLPHTPWTPPLKHTMAKQVTLWSWMVKVHNSLAAHGLCLVSNTKTVYDFRSMNMSWSFWLHRISLTICSHDKKKCEEHYLTTQILNVFLLLPTYWLDEHREKDGDDLSSHWWQQPCFTILFIKKKNYFPRNVFL